MGKGTGDGAAICGAACLSCCIIIFVLGMFALGIAEIVIGAVYIHDCSLEKMIPIYLIVAGCAPLLFGGMGKSGDEDEGLTCGSICGMVGTLFNLAWLICGTVWVYPNYALVNKDTYVPCPAPGGDANVTTTLPPGCTVGTCNETLMKFSFAMVTLNWICMAAMITVVGCTIARVCCK